MPNASLKPTSSSPATTPAPERIAHTIADVLQSEYRGVSLYQVALLLLTIAILWTGITTVQQTQHYHQTYNQLNQLKKDFRQLQIERQRMLIEQQTFSATPQITNRAVTQLRMFYPNLSDRMILHTDGMPTAQSTPLPAATKIDRTDKPPIDPASQH